MRQAHRANQDGVAAPGLRQCRARADQGLARIFGQHHAGFQGVAILGGRLRGRVLLSVRSIAGRGGYGFATDEEYGMGCRHAGMLALCTAIATAASHSRYDGNMTQPQPASPQPDITARFRRANAWAAGVVVGSSVLSTVAATLYTDGSAIEKLAAIGAVLVLADPVGRCFKNVVEAIHPTLRSPWLPSARHLGHAALSASALAVYSVGFTGIFATASTLASDKTPLTAAVALGVTALACASMGMVDAIAATRRALQVFGAPPPPPDMQKFAAPEDPPKPPRRRGP